MRNRSLPPCEEFSRHSMPWTRRKNPPTPNLALLERCRKIAVALGAPLVLENVRAAQAFIGKSAHRIGPFHLWGDVPLLLPDYGGRKKESYGSRKRASRAKIPLELALAVGRWHFPF